jgi:triacylglycerol lipase
MNRRIAMGMTLVVSAVLVAWMPSNGSTAEATAVPCGASEADIYTPSRIGFAPPGSILGCRPVVLSDLRDDVAVRAWKVKYVSTNVDGDRVAVSGTVAVPRAAWTGGGARPVVGFSPGTMGLGTGCSLSRDLTEPNGFPYEAPNLAAALRAGWAVAATDGMGYLTGQTHTYMVGRNAGHAQLDAVRAAMRLPGADVSRFAPVGLWGYSEGGAATLWASQLASSYAPDLWVAGSAAGGVPGDLAVTGEALNGSPYAGFQVDALIGLATAYPNLPLGSLLNEHGHWAVKTARESCLLDTVRLLGGQTIEGLTTHGLTLEQFSAVTGPDGVSWGEVVNAQKLGVGIGGPFSFARYRIRFPVLQYRGAAEDIIPVSTEKDTRSAYCAAGITTQWEEVQGNHLGADTAAAPAVIAWFTDRFAWRHTTGNC